MTITLPGKIFLGLSLAGGQTESFHSFPLSPHPENPIEKGISGIGLNYTSTFLGLVLPDTLLSLLLLIELLVWERIGEVAGWSTANILYRSFP